MSHVPIPPPARKGGKSPTKESGEGGAPRVPPLRAPVRPAGPSVEWNRLRRPRRRPEPSGRGGGTRVYVSAHKHQEAQPRARAGWGQARAPPLPPSSRDGPVSTSSRRTLASKTARFSKDISILTGKPGSLKWSQKSPWSLRSVTPGGHGAHALPESFTQTLAPRVRFHTADTGLWRLRGRLPGARRGSGCGRVSGSHRPHNPGAAASQSPGPHEPPSPPPPALRPSRTASRTSGRPAGSQGPHRSGPGQGRARGQLDAASQGT